MKGKQKKPTWQEGEVQGFRKIVKKKNDRGWFAAWQVACACSGPWVETECRERFALKLAVNWGDGAATSSGALCAGAERAQAASSRGAGWASAAGSPEAHSGNACLLPTALQAHVLSVSELFSSELISPTRKHTVGC